MNGSIGEFLFQLLQQMHQGIMLRKSERVLGQKHSLAVFAFDRLSFGINAITPVGTPNVANTNAIAIVSLAMCAWKEGDPLQWYRLSQSHNDSLCH